jgi:hypothetical protein
VNTTLVVIIYFDIASIIIIPPLSILDICTITTGGCIYAGTSAGAVDFVLSDVVLYCPSSTATRIMILIQDITVFY